jgi:tetratricopeptide (TPR) repeat protein
MTLNLTVVSPKHIYQCSDFRLSYKDGYYNDEEAQKIVVVSSLGWTALVQFTGVARTDRGFDTTKFLAKLAGSPIKIGTSPQWIISRLLEAGKVHIGTGPLMDLTFSVVGFEQTKPFVFVVSNFQTLDTQQPVIVSPLQTRRWTVSTSAQKHLVFPTGYVKDVRPDDLRDLGAVARKCSPSVVHKKLADVNKTIAKRAGCSIGPISCSCFTGHLRSDGAGDLMPHDVNPGGEYLPEFFLRTVSRGPQRMDFKAKVDSDGKPLPRRLVQIALNRGITTGRPMPAYMFFGVFENVEEVIAPPESDEDPTRQLMLEAERFRGLGDYAQARPLYERVLRIRENRRGPEHPDTATSLNNLAGLLQDQADLEGAQPLFERALKIREKVLDLHHPDTATSLNNLAVIRRAQGDVEGARPLFERALEIRETVLGPEHPDTATSLNNLADLLQGQADLASARPLFERALKIREKVLGPHHLDTAASLNNLARLLQAQRKFGRALRLYRDALKIFEKVLGPDHPDTAASLNNLACLLHAQGELNGARPLYERALRIVKKALGPEHPCAVAVRRNLTALGR